MTADVITERLCHLAADERRLRSDRTNPLKLMRKLIEDSGYSIERNTLNRTTIISVLTESPKLVHDWWLWSGDQRWPEGWCLDECNGQYSVYYYPEGENLRFTDRLHACAEYIVRVIHWILNRANGVS